MSTPPTTRPTVLFVCIHNAGRSQMAAALLERGADGQADVVITMGCGDACPIFPGRRYLDWKLADPAGQGIDAVRPIRDDIDDRVRALLTELTG